MKPRLLRQRPRVGPLVLAAGLAVSLAACGGSDDPSPTTPTNADALASMVDALNSVGSVSVSVETTGQTATFEGTTDWTNVRLLDGDGQTVWLRVAGVDYAAADYCPTDEAGSDTPACSDPDLEGKFYSSGEETGSAEGSTMFSDMLANDSIVALSTSTEPVDQDGDDWVLSGDGITVTMSAGDPHYPSEVWLRESSSESGESTTTFSDFNGVPLFEAPTADEILAPAN